MLILGIMSGTSLDGLDLCLCEFSESNSIWQYSIIKAKTYDYNDIYRQQLMHIENASATELLLFNNSFGKYIADKINHFCSLTNLTPQLICSHGHTIFHQPDKNFTYQIGSGAVIATQTGIDTICDFRSSDVALGGQGAPLVPIGDEFLFSAYDYCLNLGGFANISEKKNGKRIAWDICPVNIVINKLVSAIGKDFDNKGLIAQKGSLNKFLLNELNAIPFFSQTAPKSLGKEWVLSNYLPIIEKYNDTIENILHTIYHNIAIQIAQSTTPNKTILITGGGAYNSFLISLIEQYSNCSICIPDKLLIDFKEALLFAFLGFLFINNKNNSLQSVTGASADSIGGCLYKSNKNNILSE